MMRASVPFVWLFTAALLLLTAGPQSLAQTSKKKTASKSKTTASSSKKPAPSKTASKASSKNASPKSASSKSRSAKKPASASSKRKSASKRRTTASRSRSRRGPSQAKPTPERYSEIQRALQQRGYLDGEAGGKWDVASVEALKQFQKDQNLTPDGKLNSLSLIALGLGPQRGGAHLPGSPQAGPAQPPSEPPPAPEPPKQE
jgi:hypothetical protein